MDHLKQLHLDPLFILALEKASSEDERIAIKLMAENLLNSILDVVSNVELNIAEISSGLSGSFAT